MASSRPRAWRSWAKRLVGGHGAEQGARHVAGDQLHGEEDHHRDAEQDGDQAEQPLEDVDDHAGCPCVGCSSARAQPLAVGGGLLGEARLEELVHRAAQDRVGVGPDRQRAPAPQRVHRERLERRGDVVFEGEVHAHARAGRLEAPASGDRDELAAQREAALAVSVLARAADRERGGLLLAVHDGQVERVVERLPGRRTRRAGRCPGSRGTSLAGRAPPTRRPGRTTTTSQRSR